MCFIWCKTKTIVYSENGIEYFFVNKTKLADVEPAFGEFDGDMYAGLLPIDIVNEEKRDDVRGKLMFWYFQPTNENYDSVTIWLNGGPGCTSFSAGLLFEM